MKTNAELKSNQKRTFFSFVIIFLSLVYIAPLQAQTRRDHRTKKNATVRDHRNKGGEDPFTRLKMEAKKTSVLKSKMKPVKVTVNSPSWKGTSRDKIKFVPFKLEDKNGRAVPANRNITLKNGKSTTAQEAINRLNETEKKLNAQGYSLRNKVPKTISRTYTSNNYLNGRRLKAPKSIGARKQGANLKKYMSLEKKVGVVTSFNNVKGKTITLKPYSMYTESEKKEVNKYNYSKTSGGTIMAKKLITPRRFQKFRIQKIGNLSAIYEHKPTDKVANWNFGHPNTFQASIEGRLHRYAKIYPFDSENPEKNKSEFNVSATGKVKGTILNNSMDILHASGEFNAPSDVSKKMTTKIQLKILGTALVNESKSFAQKHSISKSHSKSFDNSFEFEIPIIAGIDFVGLIGVKGELGFEYEGKIERTIASIEAKPLVNLQAYGKAGLEFAEIFGGGIESELSFVKGDLDLQAYAGIWNQNSQEIVVGFNHYFGYDINMLSGSLDAYAEACVPDFVPFYGGDCKRFTHNVFKWDGFKASGTIAEGSITHTLANIAKYDEELKMKGN
ncbi:hypothetical protein [Maribacter sp. HTCC2170]|uniref:hypothetical protein n=1 Tax=Maribacter sp. (strain HTCC2170 / KCCM 42371) TaxID=313603 RepID=UPI00006B46FC|nr:hypothetical protein [Maribacter sp. HTCC2170]EAR01994.1 hypothetical protein FB2170_15738 [Maribacter sp. HTCC2170]